MRVWTHGSTLSSVENVYTWRQHGFGNAIKAQCQLVSRRPSYLVVVHFWRSPYQEREVCRCLWIPLWNDSLRGAYEEWSLTRGFKYSVLTWKLLVFWKTSRWEELVVYERLSQPGVRLYNNRVSNIKLHLNNTFSTSIYGKKTFTGLYTKWDSFTPLWWPIRAMGKGRRMTVNSWIFLFLFLFYFIFIFLFFYIF